MSATAHREILRRLFPAAVLTAEGPPDEWQGELLPEEAASLERMVEKRRREFIAGRVASRALLARLGFGAAALPMAEDRRPLWPAGAVGSISHTDGYCGVAVARAADVAGVGLDIEVAGAVTRPVFPAILGESERAWVAGQAVPERWATVLFSAKEAVYKAWNPVHRSFLGFEDVEVEVDAPGGRFRANLRGGGALPGRFAFAGRWVFTGVVLDAGA